MELTQIDRDFINQVKISMDFGKPKVAVPTWAGATVWQVPFQFAPRITQDSKRASWKQENQKYYEPIVHYDGADARQIQLKWRYAVTGGYWNGKKWNALNIHKILSNLKAYYYRTFDSYGAINVDGNTEAMPIIKIDQLYQYIPSGGGTSTWRSTNINITPSEHMVYDNTSNFSSALFPLFVDVSMDLLLITQIEFTSYGEDVKSGEITTGQKLKNVPSKPSREWI